MTRATDLETAALHALNDFLQEHQGRAPRLLEMNADDWAYMDAFLRDHRTHGFITFPPIDPAKVGGRQNFVIFGLPVVAAREGIEGGAPPGTGEVRAVATC